MSDTWNDVEAFYDEHGETLGLTGDYEHLEPVLPDVSGKRVLDTGCGLGDGSQYLAEQGGTVVGVDISSEHIDTAREEYGDAVDFYSADLTEGLDFLDDGQFDLVVCALTLRHVEEWGRVFEGFSRVLDDDGTVVVHAHHPFVDYLELAIEQSEHITGESDRYDPARPPRHLLMRFRKSVK